MDTNKVETILCSDYTYPISPSIVFTPNGTNISQIKLYIENETESRIITISANNFGYYPTDLLIVDSYDGDVIFNGVRDKSLIDSDFPKFTRKKNKIYIDLEASQSVYMSIQYRENFYV